MRRLDRNLLRLFRFLFLLFWATREKKCVWFLFLFFLKYYTFVLCCCVVDFFDFLIVCSLYYYFPLSHLFLPHFYDTCLLLIFCLHQRFGYIINMLCVRYNTIFVCLFCLFMKLREKFVGDMSLKYQSLCRFGPNIFLSQEF